MNMRRLLSRIINLLIAVIVLWVWLSMTFRLGRLGSQSEGGFGNLRYFTVLSNLLQGGVSLAYACGIRTGRFKFASTTAITFTFFIVLLFLGPKRGYDVVYAGANFWSHLIVPVLAMADFLVLDRECTFTMRDTFIAVIPTLAYGLFYMGNLLVGGAEGNDWYGFQGFGAGAGIGIYLILLAANWIIALILRLPRRGA
jgi:hypothetical protein